MDAFVAPVRVWAHVSQINILAQGIKAFGEYSSFSLIDSLFHIEPVVAGHSLFSLFSDNSEAFDVE